MAFGGNPNVTITAINTSGGIACSRTSGQTPCFIHVSAQNITATGTSVPYEDLEYTWDFGDASGTEVFDQAINLAGNIVTETPVNMNSAQTGPEAAYCYRSAGSFTITLSVRGKNGGAFTTSSVTQVIAVSAFSAGGTFYLDSVNGSDAFDGLHPLPNTPSAGNGPKQSKSNLITWTNGSQTTSNVINLAQGSSWIDATDWEIDTLHPFRVQSYVGQAGAGAKPIVGINSGANNPLWMNNGGFRGINDAVFSGIVLKLTGTATNTSVVNIDVGFNNVHTFSNIYFDNCDIVSDTTTTGLINFSFTYFDDTTVLVSGFGIWGGNNTMQLTPFVGPKHGFFGGAEQWSFIYGVTFSGAGSDTTFDHHIYPEVWNNVCFRYNNFQSGPGRGYCINTNAKPGTAGTFSQYVIFSDNYFSGTAFGHDLSNQNNDTNGTFKNIVDQRNAYTNITNQCLEFASATTYTVRDNLVYGVGGFYSPGNVGILTAALYRNNIYQTGTLNQVLDYSGSGVWATAQTQTDNIIYDTRNPAGIVYTTSFAALSGSTASIDRNQYYFPNSTTAFGNGGTASSFSTWKAAGFDTNGSVGDPAWNNPSAGNFSTGAGSVGTRAGKSGRGLSF